MKALSLPTALLAAAALLLVAAPAHADQDPAQGAAQLPPVPSLADTSEYQALAGLVSPLEALAKKKRCTKTKSGKKCSPATLSEDDFDSASADIDSALDGLDSLVSDRSQDREDAIEEWAASREAFLNDPLNARYDSVNDYAEAWLDGGSYTCYRGGDFNNCPGDAPDGSVVAINLTGNPADDGKGRLEIIEDKLESDTAGLIESAQQAIKQNCAKSSKYGDAVIAELQKAAKKKAKSKKAKKDVAEAKKKLAKAKESRARCDAGISDAADNFDTSDLDALAQDLQDAAEAYAAELEQSNEDWYDRAKDDAQRNLDKGATLSERAAEKADRSDEVALTKIERRAQRALDRVEP